MSEEERTRAALAGALDRALAENPDLPPLSAEQRAALVTHGALLARWNRVHNLTRVERPEDVARRHFADSLAGLAALERHVLAQGSAAGPSGSEGRPAESRPALGARVADVGSGAGFPGVVAALLWPAREVVLIEAARKRASFLRQVGNELGLRNLRIENARAEDVAGAGFDLVMTRATLPWDSLPRLGRLLAPGGWLGAWVSEQPSDAEWNHRLGQTTAPEQPDPEQPGPEQTDPEQTDPEQTDPEQPDPELREGARVPYAVAGLPERAVLLARAACTLSFPPEAR